MYRQQPERLACRSKKILDLHRTTLASSVGIRLAYCISPKRRCGARLLMTVAVVVGVGGLILCGVA
jgi:hypothetical protein